MNKFEFFTHSIRKSPDPVFKESKSQRYYIICNVLDLPTNLPTDPNPRPPEVDKRIWKEIAESLMNENETPNSFHLKNKGITIIADHIEDSLDKEKISIVCKEGEGILDGGHTYQLILQHQKLIREYNENTEEESKKINQFVKIEILTGLPSFVPITEIAGGLNTGTQVKLISLSNLGERFLWIKEELQNEDYFKSIAWRENEEAAYDAFDLISLLELFNIKQYPTKGSGKSQPMKAYTSKTLLSNYYLAHQDEYENLRPILKDILVLRDIIDNEAPVYYNKSGGKFGGTGLALKKKVKYQLVFINKKSNTENALHRAALFPILAAFRYFVAFDTNGKAYWKHGFQQVVEFWRTVAQDLVEVTVRTNTENRNNVSLLGRDQSHWDRIFQSVKTAYLERLEE